MEHVQIFDETATIAAMVAPSTDTLSARVRALAREEAPRATELRRELNALVAATHHRTGRPHGWIHNELRRICGGPPVAAANGDQLQDRIDAVRSLQI